MPLPRSNVSRKGRWIILATFLLSAIIPFIITLGFINRPTNQIAYSVRGETTALHVVRAVISLGWSGILFTFIYYGYDWARYFVSLCYFGATLILIPSVPDSPVLLGVAIACQLCGAAVLIFLKEVRPRHWIY